MINKPGADATRAPRCESALTELSNHHAEGIEAEHRRREHRHENHRNIAEGVLSTEQIEGISERYQFLVSSSFMQHPT